MSRSQNRAIRYIMTVETIFRCPCLGKFRTSLCEAWHDDQRPIMRLARITEAVAQDESFAFPPVAHTAPLGVFKTAGALVAAG
jgi:hypothetical protein